MRRPIFALFTVMALILTAAAPVAADTSGQVSGTYKSISAFSQDCVPQGARTTCTETGLDVYTATPPMVTVCITQSTYTFSDRTGRGRLISSQSGCTDLVDGSGATITVTQDQLTATLAPTQITLTACDRRTCTEVGTVAVSAALAGAPVQPFSSRQTYKDGTCTYRHSETGNRADVSGSISIGAVTLTAAGSAQQSEIKVDQTCR
ncbi:MAG TPA: hypothetical protein VIR16_02725 [Candidatus Limnocylindrales bacterium]